jgi:WD40 repeat protein
MTVAAAPAAVAGASALTSPYRGLLPFSEAESRYFFGRDDDREIITANLIAARLTLLYSPSGVGKTSVLLAGVMADLHRLARDDAGGDEGPEYVPVAVRRWSGDPIATIDAAIAAAMERVLGAAAPAPPGDARLVDRVRAWARDGDTTLLLLFDQFEEFLLYHGGAWEPGGAARELADVLSARDVPANVLLGLREDALASLDRFKGRVPHLFDNYLRLAHLDEDAARDAITGPIEQWNIDHPDDRMEVEPALVDAVVDEVRTGRILLGRAGGAAPGDGRGGGVETPFLQLVLTRIWEEERARGSPRLTAQTLRQLGGAAEIVRTHLDLHMAGLRRHDRDVAAAVFHHLVTPSGTKVARSLDDLAAYTGYRPDEIEAVLGTLSQGDWRIVRRVREPGAADSGAWEIYHDVLAEAVLDWRARHEERRRRARILRRALAVGIVVVLVAAVALVVAFVERRRGEAEDSARQARAEGLAASALLALDVAPEQALRDARRAVELGRDAPGPQTALRAAVAKGDLVSERRTAPISALRLGQDGSHLAVGTQAGSVHVWPLGRPGELRVREAGRPVKDVALSPRGDRVAVLEPAEDDRPARLVVYDVERGRPVAARPVADPAAATLRWAPRGSRLLVLGSRAAVVDAASGDARDLGRADQMAWSPSGGRIAIARPSGAVVVLRAGDGDRIGAVPGEGEVEAVSFTPDGSDVLAARHDGRVSGIAHGCPRGGSIRPERAAFSPGGRFLAVADERVLGVWSIATCRRVDLPLPAGVAIRRIAISADGSLAAATGADRIAHVWDVQRGTEIAALPGGWERDARVVIRAAPDGGDLIFTAGDDGLLRQWRVGGQPLGAVAASLGVRAAAFDTRPGKLVVAGSDGIRRVDWRRGGRGIRQGPAAAVATAAFSDDGSTVAVATRGGSLRVRATGGARWRTLGGAGAWPAPASLSLSAAGDRLAAVGQGGRAAVWDTGTGERRDAFSIPGADASPYALLTPDGRGLVVAGDSLRLRTVGGGDRQLDDRGAPPERQGPSIPAAVRGDALVTTIAQGYPTLYGLGAATADRFYDRVSRRTRAMALDPGGDVLATAGPDGLRLWDRRSGQPFTLLSRAGFDALRFSRGGQFLLASGPEDGVVVFACRPCGRIDELLARTAGGPFESRLLLPVLPLLRRGVDAPLAEPEPEPDPDAVEPGVAWRDPGPTTPQLVPTPAPPVATATPESQTPAPTEPPTTTSPVLPNVPTAPPSGGVGGGGGGD